MIYEVRGEYSLEDQSYRTVFRISVVSDYDAHAIEEVAHNIINLNRPKLVRFHNVHIFHKIEEKDNETR